MPIVAQGGTVTLSVNVGHANGNPADDPSLALTVLDPVGDPVAGFPVAIPPIVRDEIGAYHYVWSVPVDLAVGGYTASWEATVDGADASGSELVEVVAVGAIEPQYLSLAELKTHVTSTLADSALQDLLDAAYDAIIEYAGTDGPVSELYRVHGDLLLLARPAASVVSVIEQDVTLAADDYEIRGTGRTLRRLATGTNPASYWCGRVDVSYMPRSEAAQRKVVQLELVKLDLAFSPGGLASQRIGEWQESYATNAGGYDEQHAAILGRLRSGGVMIQ